MDLKQNIVNRSETDIKIDFKNRVNRMLQATYPYDAVRLQKYLHPAKGNSLLELITVSSKYKESSEAKKISIAAERIALGMQDYLSDLPLPPALKQRTYNELFTWLERIIEKYNVAAMSPEDYLTEPVTEDTGVRMVKLLHEKISKGDLAEKLGVSKRATQDWLRGIDSSLSEKDDKEGVKDVRFAGQKVYGEIKCTGEAGKSHYYKMENTIHPVAMQLNVMQVGVLLKSLQTSVYDGSSLVGRGIALDIWAQLTEYGKDRIKTVFAEKDEDLKLFIDELEDGISSGDVPMFKTEAQLFQEGDVNRSDELKMAMKADRTCDIIIKKDGTRSTILKCKIRPGIATDYIIVSANQKESCEEGIALNEDDILSVNIYY